MKTFAKILSLALVAVMLCMTLVACGPAADPADAKAALTDNGYTATNDDTIQPGILKLAGIDGVTNVVHGIKDKDYVYIYYFEDADAAKAAMEKIEEQLEDAKEDGEEISIKRSGKMIYGGTEAAIKAAK